MSELAKERCQPCHGAVAALPEEEAQALLALLHPNWGSESGRMRRRVELRDFAAAFALAAEVALLAEREDHHPDMRVGWGYLELELTTHQAGGLTRNDFIMAAKVDEILDRREGGAAAHQQPSVPAPKD